MIPIISCFQQKIRTFISWLVVSWFYLFWASHFFTSRPVSCFIYRPLIHCSVLSLKIKKKTNIRNNYIRTLNNKDIRVFFSSGEGVHSGKLNWYICYKYVTNNSICIFLFLFYLNIVFEWNIFFGGLGRVGMFNQTLVYIKIIILIRF